MSWAWSPYGGWLGNYGYFDRGGSVIIFNTAAIAGIVASVVLGPRYGRFMSKADVEKIRAGGAE